MVEELENRMRTIDKHLHAEKQLVKALPKMAQACSTPQLREAFEQHLLETKQQVGRAEQVFQIFGRQPERKNDI